MTAKIHTALDELTIHKVGALAPRLFAAARSGEALNLDLSCVSQFDTAGLQLLLALKREAVRTNTQLCLDNPSPAVTELMGFYNLGESLQQDAAPRSSPA